MGDSEGHICNMQKSGIQPNPKFMSWLRIIENGEKRHKAVMDSVIQPLLKNGVKGDNLKLALQQLSSQCTVYLEKLSPEEINRYTQKEQKPMKDPSKYDASVNTDSASTMYRTKTFVKKRKRIRVLSDSDTDGETLDNNKTAIKIISDPHQDVQSRKSDTCHNVESNNNEEMKDRTVGTCTVLPKQLNRINTTETTKKKRKRKIRVLSDSDADSETLDNERTPPDNVESNNNKEVKDRAAGICTVLSKQQNRINDVQKRNSLLDKSTVQFNKYFTDNPLRLDTIDYNDKHVFGIHLPKTKQPQNPNENALSSDTGTNVRSSVQTKINPNKNTLTTLLTNCSKSYLDFNNHDSKISDVPALSPEPASTKTNGIDSVRLPPKTCDKSATSNSLHSHSLSHEKDINVMCKSRKSKLTKKEDTQHKRHIKTGPDLLDTLKKNITKKNGCHEMVKTDKENDKTIKCSKQDLNDIDYKIYNIDSKQFKSTTILHKHTGKSKSLDTLSKKCDPTVKAIVTNKNHKHVPSEHKHTKYSFKKESRPADNVNKNITQENINKKSVDTPNTVPSRNLNNESDVLTPVQKERKDIKSTERPKIESYSKIGPGISYKSKHSKSSISNNHQSKYLQNLDKQCISVTSKHKEKKGAKAFGLNTVNSILPHNMAYKTTKIEDKKSLQMEKEQQNNFLNNTLKKLHSSSKEKNSSRIEKGDIFEDKGGKKIVVSNELHVVESEQTHSFVKKKEIVNRDHKQNVCTAAVVSDERNEVFQNQKIDVSEKCNGKNINKLYQKVNTLFKNSDSKCKLDVEQTERKEDTEKSEVIRKTISKEKTEDAIKEDSHFKANNPKGFILTEPDKSTDLTSKQSDLKQTSRHHDNTDIVINRAHTFSLHKKDICCKKGKICNKERRRSSNDTNQDDVSRWDKKENLKSDSKSELTIGKKSKKNSCLNDCSENNKMNSKQLQSSDIDDVNYKSRYTRTEDFVDDVLQTDVKKSDSVILEKQNNLIKERKRNAAEDKSDLSEKGMHFDNIKSTNLKDNSMFEIKDVNLNLCSKGRNSNENHHSHNAKISDKSCDISKALNKPKKDTNSNNYNENGHKRRRSSDDKHQGNGIIGSKRLKTGNLNNREIRNQRETFLYGKTKQYSKNEIKSEKKVDKTDANKLRSDSVSSDDKSNLTKENNIKNSVRNKQSISKTNILKSDPTTDIGTSPNLIQDPDKNPKTSKEIKKKIQDNKTKKVDSKDNSNSTLNEVKNHSLKEVKSKNSSKSDDLKIFSKVAVNVSKEGSYQIGKRRNSEDHTISDKKLTCSAVPFPTTNVRLSNKMWRNSFISLKDDTRSSDKDVKRKNLGGNETNYFTSNIMTKDFQSDADEEGLNIKKKKLSTEDCKNDQRNPPLKITSVGSSSSKTKFEAEIVPHKSFINPVLHEEKDNFGDNETLALNKVEVDHSASSTSTKDCAIGISKEKQSPVNNKIEILTHDLLKVGPMPFCATSYKSGVETESDITTEKEIVSNSKYIISTSLERKHSGSSNAKLDFEEILRKISENISTNSSVGESDENIHTEKRQTFAIDNILHSNPKLPDTETKDYKAKTLIIKTNDIKKNFQDKQSYHKTESQSDDCSFSQTEKTPQGGTHTNESVLEKCTPNTVLMLGFSKKQNAEIIQEKCLNTEVNPESVLACEVLTDNKLDQYLKDNKISTDGSDTKSNNNISVCDTENAVEISHLTTQYYSALNAFHLSITSDNCSSYNTMSSLEGYNRSVQLESEVSSPKILENKENSQPEYNKSSVTTPLKCINKEIQDVGSQIGVIETGKYEPVQSRDATPHTAVESSICSQINSAQLVKSNTVNAISKDYSPLVCEPKNSINYASTSKTDQSIDSEKSINDQDTFREGNISNPVKTFPKLYPQKIVFRKQTYCRKRLPRLHQQNNFTSLVQSDPVKHSFITAKKPVKFNTNKNNVNFCSKRSKGFYNRIGFTPEQIKLLKFKSAHNKVSKSSNIRIEVPVINTTDKVYKDSKVTGNINKEEKKKKMYLNLFGEDCDPEPASLDNTSVIKKVHVPESKEEQSEVEEISFIEKVHVEESKKEQSEIGKFSSVNKVHVPESKEEQSEVEKISFIEKVHVSESKKEQSEIEEKTKDSHTTDTCNSTDPVKNTSDCSLIKEKAINTDPIQCNVVQLHNKTGSKSLTSKKASIMKIMKKVTADVNKFKRKHKNLSKKFVTNEPNEQHLNNPENFNESCSQILPSMPSIDEGKHKNLSKKFVASEPNEQHLNNPENFNESCSQILPSVPSIDKGKHKNNLSKKFVTNEPNEQHLNNPEFNESCSKILPSMPSIDDSVSIQDFLSTLDDDCSKKDIDFEKDCTLYKAPQSPGLEVGKSQAKQLSCTLSVRDSKVVSELLEETHPLTHTLSGPTNIKTNPLKSVQSKHISQVQNLKCGLETNIKDTEHVKTQVDISRGFNEYLFSCQNECTNIQLSNKNQEIGSFTGEKIKFVKNLELHVQKDTASQIFNQMPLDQNKSFTGKDKSVSNGVKEYDKGIKLNVTKSNPLVVDEETSISFSNICDESVVSSSTVSPEPITALVTSISLNGICNSESKVGKIRVKDAKELGITTGGNFSPSQTNCLRTLLTEGRAGSVSDNSVILNEKDSSSQIDGYVSSTVFDRNPITNNDVFLKENSFPSSNGEVPNNVQFVDPADSCIKNTMDCSSVQEQQVKICESVSSDNSSSAEKPVKSEDSDEKNLILIGEREQNVSKEIENENVPFSQNHIQNIQSISEALPRNENIEQNSLHMSVSLNRSSSHSKEQNCTQGLAELNMPLAQTSEVNYVITSSTVSSESSQSRIQNVVHRVSDINITSDVNIKPNSCQEYAGVHRASNQNVAQTTGNVQINSNEENSVTLLKKKAFFEEFHKWLTTSNAWIRNKEYYSQVYMTVFHGCETITSKLAEILHLVLVYKKLIGLQIAQIRKLSSESLIQIETKRVNKAYQENILARGKDFCPLFRTMLKKIEQYARTDLFFEMLFIFYEKIIDNLLKIDTCHNDCIISVRSIISDMIDAVNNRTNCISYIILKLEDEKFRVGVTKVKDNLLSVRSCELKKQFLESKKSEVSRVASYNGNIIRTLDTNQSTILTQNINFQQTSVIENSSSSHLNTVNDDNDDVFVDFSSPTANFRPETNFIINDKATDNTNLNNYNKQPEMIDYSSLHVSTLNKRGALSNVEKLTYHANSLSPTNKSRSASNNCVISLMSPPQSKETAVEGVASNSKQINCTSEHINATSERHYRTVCSRRNSDSTYISVNSAFRQPDLLRGRSLVENTSNASNSSIHTLQTNLQAELFSNSLIQQNNMYKSSTNTTVNSQLLPTTQTEPVLPNPNIRVRRPFSNLPLPQNSFLINESQGNVQTLPNNNLIPMQHVYNSLNTYGNNNNIVVMPTVQHHTPRTQQTIDMQQNQLSFNQRYMPQVPQQMFTQQQAVDHARQIYDMNTLNYSSALHNIGETSCPANSHMIALQPLYSIQPMSRNNYPVYRVPNVQQNLQADLSQRNSGQPNTVVTKAVPNLPRLTCSYPPCNNPANIKCNTCNKVYYCSSECQREDWRNQHFLICI